jgi:hypothetical protein
VKRTIRKAAALGVFLIAASAIVACKSIPSLNEPALYSTYSKAQKDAPAESAVQFFVLYRSGGNAGEDKYEYLVERRPGEAGTVSFVLSMRYTGYAPESIERIAAKADDRDLALSQSAVTRGYSGRYRMELVQAELGPAVTVAIAAAGKMSIQYFGKYPTFPIEIPGPGLEALKAFLGG